MLGILKISLLLTFSVLLVYTQTRKQKTFVISDVNDLKDFKKLLRTKTNVMIIYINNPKMSQAVSNTFNHVASLVKGQATLVSINCNNVEGKKLCKKMKISTDKAYYLKHYKDGEFNIDYTRAETVNAMVNFLRDPTGDLPWDEDPAAIEIFHLQDQDALSKFLKKGEGAYKKSMIMFYAPWCGYCKILKPEYLAAASDLKGAALLAAMDASKAGNSRVRQEYNITGFPTLLYFERGQYKFPYNGEHKQKEIVDFIKDPTFQLQKKKQEKEEGWTSEESDIVHLTAENFDSTLEKAKHALVVFYAPWCGHCKKIKPEYEKASKQLKETGIEGVLAAVDATREAELAKRFNVKGYPTLKYFQYGQFKFDASHVRQENQIVDFIKNPQQPPPPPPPEAPWTEEQSAVRHLDGDTFRSTLRKIKHALVMFYAPWCGHCKSTKPEFVKAASQFADELLVAFGAVDCTAEQALCASYDVKGYPSIKYFSYHDKLVKDYSGGRKEADFVLFINSQMGNMHSKKAVSNQDAGFGPSVTLLNDDNFESVVGETSPTFVMFYATWCGHCSTVKPNFSRLATTFKTENSPVKIVAVDAAENPKVADLAAIENLPTFKLYSAGKVIATYDGDRSYEDMVQFIKSKHVRDEL